MATFAEHLGHDRDQERLRHRLATGALGSAFLLVTMVVLLAIT